MEGFLCFAAVAGLIGVLIWQFSESQRAVATTTVQTRYDPGKVAEIVRSEFEGARSLLWAKTGGPGTINVRRRGVRGGITMSITIESRPGGGSQVDMWASETVTYLGVLVNFAGVVNRRKKAIWQLLTA